MSTNQNKQKIEKIGYEQTYFITTVKDYCKACW